MAKRNYGCGGCGVLLAVCFVGLLFFAVIFSNRENRTSEPDAPKSFSEQPAKVSKKNTDDYEIPMTSEFWPSEVTLLKDAEITGSSEYGTFKRRVKAGTKIHAETKDGKALVISSDGMLGTVPSNQTDFLKLAEANRKTEILRRKEMIDQQRMEAQQALAKSAREEWERSKINLHVKISQIVGTQGIIAYQISESPSEPIFIDGNFQGHADGDDVSVDAWPNGTFKYKTVLGAPKTVHRYSTTHP